MVSNKHLLKCVGCYSLMRGELDWVNHNRVVFYSCRQYFPYACAFSGLQRPASGIREAVKDCPEDLARYCLFCRQPSITGIGPNGQIHLCEKHYDAWSKYLDAHPEQEARISPGGRLRSQAWVEVFREFLESQRKCRVCGCTNDNACMTDKGPCSWVAPDLCSACEGSVTNNAKR
jgi:hypothetical protein